MPRSARPRPTVRCVACSGPYQLVVVVVVVVVEQVLVLLRGCQKLILVFDQRLSYVPGTDFSVVL